MPYSVTLRCSADEVDLLLARCMDYETTGLEQDGESLTAYFAAPQEADRFAAGFAAYSPVTQAIAPRNWAEEWQRGWKPIQVGRRLYLAPGWDSSPTPEGRIRLEMRPGLAFGGGDHPTTRLCLELLEEYVRPGMTVADIGCGSGILSDAARKLGARAAVACDIDWMAAQSALENVPGAMVYCGPAVALRSESMDLVVANLLTGVVVGLLPTLSRLLRPSGILIASGFPDEQAELIAGRAAPLGLVPIDQRSQDQWAASVHRRQDAIR